NRLQITLGGEAKRQGGVGDKDRVRAHDAIRSAPEHHADLATARLAVPPVLALVAQRSGDAGLDGAVLISRGCHHDQPSVLQLVADGARRQLGGERRQVSRGERPLAYSGGW